MASITVTAAPPVFVQQPASIAVLAGYPGSVAATWQQIGRAGRRRDASVAILVASAAPVDQYVVHHPEFLLANPPEEARVDPDNLPAWAAGLVDGAVATDGDALLLESPMGRIVVRFVPHNELGVLDHDVTTPSGATTTSLGELSSLPSNLSAMT